ncbi:MAG: hypothetical protein WBL35_09700 [Ornithinibacter sp.]
MTDDETDLTNRERRERTLQEVIDALVEDPQHRSVAEAVDDLERRIADRGLPAMPPQWVHAVAEGVVRGDPYVVSADTLRQMDIPAPTTRAEPYVID